MFTCNICNKKFLGSQYLKAHRELHLGTEKFKCDICGKNFTLKSHLINHLKLKLLKYTGEKNFTCTICNKSFALQSYLEKHMDRHRENRSYKCEICDKQFAQKRTFNEHMAAHPENQLYNCKECDMWFAIESEWKEHIADCYKKLKCGVCNKSFKYHSWLCQHEKTHEYKPYECDICNESFERKIDRKNHRRIHKEDGYKCDECGRKFTEKCNLSVHILLKHERKNFNCHICDRSFALKNYLNRHMITHSNEKPYVCNICGRFDFTTSGGFKKHKYACKQEIQYQQSNIVSKSILEEEEAVDNPEILEENAIHNLFEISGHRETGVIERATQYIKLQEIDEKFSPQIVKSEIKSNYHPKMNEPSFKSELLEIDEKFFPQIQISEKNLDYHLNLNEQYFKNENFENEEKMLPQTKLSEHKDLYSNKPLVEGGSLDVKEERLSPIDIDNSNMYCDTTSDNHLCVKCWKYFSNKADYLAHNKVCKGEILTKEEKIYYQNSQHSTNFYSPFLCIKCWKTFSYEIDFNNHKGICTESEAYISAPNSYPLDLNKRDENIKEEINQKEEEYLKNQLRQLNI